MSNVFKLDDIRAKADAKFAHTQIELGDGTLVTLRNVLQLDEKQRKALSDIDDDLSQLETFRSMVRLVVDTKANGEALIKAVGENLAFFVELFAAYNEGTQLGEA